MEPGDYIHAVTVSVFLGAMLSCSAGALALTDDSVALLPVAGTDSALVYSLQGSDDKPEVIEEDRHRLIASELGPASFTDFKILPKNRHLLADFSDRGVAATDDEGALLFSLDSPGQRPGVASASVAGYGELDRPNRILFSSNNDQRISIYDARADETVWSRALVEPPESAEIVQAIALPDRRIAVALNWPALQTSGIDLIDLDSEGVPEILVRFANREHDGAPENLVVDEDIDEINDLFATSSDELLVTTSETLMTVSLADREVTRRLSLSDRPEFAGAFISARGLPSGRIAAATVEPGVWTRPHPNHHLFWLDSTLSEIVADVSDLDRAPWRVEPAKGHGGSGTAGFEPDRTYLPSGSLEDLGLSSGLEILPDPIQTGTVGTVRATLRNSTARPVFLAAATIEAKPDRCEMPGEWKNLVERADPVVGDGAEIQLEGPVQFQSDAPTGTWCVGLRAEDRAGNRTFVGERRTFELIDAQADASGGGGRRIRPVDLGLRYASDAAGADAGTEIETRDDPKNGGGCGCSTGSPRPFGPVALLLALGGLGLARRRSN